MQARPLQATSGCRGKYGAAKRELEVIESIDNQIDFQFARWNHNFTIISIIHAAFLGAFVSKIDYIEDPRFAVLILVAVLALTGALYEIYGFSFTHIRNAIAERYRQKERYIYSVILLPVAPMIVLFLSDQTKRSQFYALLSGMIVLSWFIACGIVSKFIASEIRRSNADSSS